MTPRGERVTCSWCEGRKVIAACIFGLPPGKCWSCDGRGWHLVRRRGLRAPMTRHAKGVR